MQKLIRYLKETRTLSLLILASLSYLVFFQGRWAVALNTGYDESCYLNYVHQFWGESYPGCIFKGYFWGVALTWWPLGIFAKLFAPLFQVSFTELIVPLIGILGFLQWTVSLLLIDEIVQWMAKKTGDPNRWGSVWSYLLLMATPVSPYVFRSNFLTHAAELFLVTLTVYFLTKEKYKTSLFFAAWTFATRLNDVVLIFIVFAFLWDKFKIISLSKKQKTIFISIGVACVIPMIIKIYDICFVTGYNGFNLTHVLGGLKWEGVVKGIKEPVHGLLWHDTLWLFSLFYFAFRIHKLSKTQTVILGWQVMLFAIHSSQYIYWGYSENRLFVGSYLTLFFSLGLLWPSLSVRAQKLWGISIALTAFWRTWYFIAATAPGLRYWSEVLGHKNQEFIVSALHMLINPFKTIEITAGLSPIGFSFFSWFKDLPQFAKYQEFAKYSLNGAALWILTLFTAIVLVSLFVCVGILLARRKSRDLVHTFS